MSTPRTLTVRGWLLRSSAMASKRSSSKTTTAKSRRSVVTFSVSVDRDTKQALKAHADRAFGGNVSAMIAAFGRRARQLEALAWLVEDQGGSTLTDELREELSAQLYDKAESAGTNKVTRRSKRRTAA